MVISGIVVVVIIVTINWFGEVILSFFIGVGICIYVYIGLRLN